ncbi:hypothetical protein QBC43DRAFT_124266 [Cladorrhinum sp. PSN259]|nr:hypothetical protein QBC43DRAFT_124266 [Cladorrhinum sp. PSN259]
MVYCGKPSKGCQMCRTRRIKCDETKPTCNQCAKARRQCPGYRDEFDLLLRNENRAAERRALKASSNSTRKAKDKASKSNPSKLPTPSSTPPGSKIARNDQLIPSPASSTSSMALIPTSLNIPTKELATCHFISNFVLVPRQEEHPARGFMDFLIPLLNQNQTSASPVSPQFDGQHLQYAFNACALASLGTRVPSGSGEDPLRMASIEYMKALRSTQAALRDPQQCTEDSVLAAVLLLSMFENITAKQPNGCAWGSHIEGAIQIVKARGRKQLKTKTGLQLFIAVRTQLIIQTLTSSSPPPMGVDWWTPPSATYDPTAAACQRLNLLTAQLRYEIVATMSCSPPPSSTHIRSLLLRAQELDSEMAHWFSTLPEGWKHSTLCYIPSPTSSASSSVDYARMEVFPGRVDVYPDIWIASVTNLARTTRLVLQSLIVRCAAWCVSPMDYRTTVEYGVASRVCGEVIADVLGSVGFHFGWHLRYQDKNKGGMGRSMSKSVGYECGGGGGGEGIGIGMGGGGGGTTTKGLGGLFLSWPLCCAMGQDYATDAQRQYIIGRLRYIGDELGIRYSHILAQLHVRVPSMLIRRDGLLAKPYPMAHDFARLLGSARDGPPLLNGYNLNPLQQREVMEREQIEQGRAELLKKAAKGAKEEEGEDVRIAAAKMLVV